MKSSGQTLRRIHAEACQKGLSYYLDPDTGQCVFTWIYHEQRGYCCGNKCRHCPFGHRNVTKEMSTCAETASSD